MISLPFWERRELKEPFLLVPLGPLFPQNVKKLVSLINLYLFFFLNMDIQNVFHKLQIITLLQEYLKLFVFLGKKKTWGTIPSSSVGPFFPQKAQNLIK